jgi:YVTN family beta-propeller protein
MVLLAVVLAIGVAVARSSPRSDGTTAARGATSRTTTTPAPGTSAAAPAPIRRESRYRELPIATLGHAVADPAAGAIGDEVVFAAGLDGAGSSTSRIGSIRNSTVRTLPSLPTAFHDAAGAVLDNALYLFGGGDGVGQLDSILRVDANGATTPAGTLPTHSSDSIAATIGHTAYVVGGYDGTRWLDTIVAYAPAGGPRVVAHLPVGLRYPAVGAVNGRLVIIGGTTPSAHATTAIYGFDPATAAVTKIGDLAQPISHGSAVGVGNEVILVGGQNDAHEPQPAIVAINPTTRRIRAAGTLSAGRSDAALTNAHGHLILIGGKSATTTLDTVSELTAVPSPAPAKNVYAYDGANALSSEASAARPLIYVPNSLSNTVDVIDPTTYSVIDHFAVGELPQHVTPSWDLKTLYVDNDRGNSLTPLDPRTGKRAGPDIAVTDPYNLYFTPDGRYAIVVAEARQRLDFRDAHTMSLVKSVTVPCRGVDHMDYTADGTLALVSCEFTGQMLVVDLRHQSVRTVFDLPRRGGFPKPQDVKLSPDGSTFFVADMSSNGLWEIDAHTFAVQGFLPTGAGAHGLYPSRDARFLYATNRTAGTISVIDFSTRRIVQTWTIPGGSPDMGGVSADGKVLWLSGRNNAAVYAISTVDGHLIATIPVGRGPHGLCVWPQPGRYSIGHTGIMR